MRSTKVAAIAITLLVIPWLFFLTQQREEKAIQNVVVLVIDTLRADALGVYGNELGLSPNIDRFASESIVADRAWAQGAYTMASYMSYMSSTHVRTHGLDGNLGTAGICDWADIRMLPEVLRKHDFTTTAYVSNSNLHPKKGFPRGFQTWNDLDTNQLGAASLRRVEYDLTDAQVIKRAKRALNSWSVDQRNFLYVHILGPHLPLTPSPAARKLVGLPTDNSWRGINVKEIRKLRKTHTEEDARRTRLAYYADVFDADRAVKQLFDQLEQTGHADDTLVVLLSDHGEEIWEHGDYGHQDGVWEQLIHVPFMMRVPGRSPDRIDDRLVGLIDMVPTILPLLGIDDTEGWQGEDLFRPTTRKALVSQRFEERAINYWGGIKGIWAEQPATGTWDYFDLSVDPSEQQPLDQEHPKDLLPLAEEWAERTPEIIRPQKGEPHGICGHLSASEDREHAEALRALGYVE